MKGGILAASLLVATAAHAQNTTTIIPAPGIERYTLPPGNSQATPTPSPTPSPAVPASTLTPAPPPSVVPTLQIPRTTPSPTPTPRTPTPPPASTATPVLRATPAPTTAPRATPTPATPAAIPTDVATPPPEPTPVATEPALAPSPNTPAGGPPTWLWWAIGFAILVAGGFFVWRRFGSAREDTEVAAPEPVRQPAAPAAPTPSPPAKSAATARPSQPLTLEFRPQRLWTRGPDAHLAFELAVTNTGAAPLDAVRPVIALASAGPDTAAGIAAFTADAPSLPGSEPFALSAGETRSVAGELTLTGDRMYVTSANDRELIVPLALVSLQWRTGTSLARADDAFVIGTGDAASPRLGPIWVDRAGLVYAKLDARRFTAGPG